MYLQDTQSKRTRLRLNPVQTISACAFSAVETAPEMVAVWPLDLLPMVLLRSFVISFVLVLFCLAIVRRNHDGYGCVMDSLLAKLNICAESTKDDLAKQLVQKPLGLLKQIRTDVFECARASKLAHPNDILVPSEKRYHSP